MALLNNINVKGVPHPIVTDDGYYQGMTVGDAEQLVGTVFAEDSVPYLFRPSGGGVKVGDREYDEIVGGSLVWNQLAKIRGSGSSYTEVGVTAEFNSNTGVFAFSGQNTASYLTLFDAVSLISGHKYVMGSIAIANPNSLSFNLSMLNASLKVPVGIIKIMQSNYTIGSGFGFENVPLNTDFAGLKLRILVIDLTAMFGSTIADYIYSLEQANAGAGVAWFKKLFPKPYYEYNAGELMSVKAGSHEMVGFNQWDEEWEQGDIDTTTGQPDSPSATTIRSKNHIPVLSGTTYYFKAPQGGYIYRYDADKNYIGYAWQNQNATFVIPDGVSYIKFRMANPQYGTTYKNDICINISDPERNGEYEPYVKHTYPLDNTLELRGIPKLDSNNQLYFDGDTYESDGTVTRRYGVVDLGTLTWSYNSTYGFFAGGLPANGRFDTTAKAPIICQKYDAKSVNTSTSTMESATDKSIYGRSDEGANSHIMGKVYIKDTAYTDAATFKTAMSGVYLVYELATPTTETADPFQNPQVVDVYGTERYVDAGVEAGDRDVEIPVGHITKYQQNLRKKLEVAPDAPSSNGDYILRHSSEGNAYVPLVIEDELPTMPTEDGTYQLKVTVSDGTATLSWESEE